MNQDKIGKFIGIVTQPKSNRYITFLASNNESINYDSIVGISVNKKVIVIARIEDIKAKYYLDDPDLFFLSKAANNELDRLTKESQRPKVGLEISSRILGYYERDKNGNYKPVDISLNHYTSKPLEKVYLLDFDRIRSAYGLSKMGIKLGKVCFPATSEASIPPELFKKHTLLSGVTGSGKSRLIALIVKKLALMGAHITIVDPHDEYTNLLCSDENDYLINRISITNDDKGKKLLMKNMKLEKLYFSSQLLTAPTLSHLLPNISVQAEEQMHLIFNKVYQDVNKQRIKYLIEALDDKQKQYGKYKNDKSSFYNLFKGLYTRLTSLKEQQLIKDSIPIWLSKKSFCVDIFVGDYNKEGFGKRFISALLQQFLRLKAQDDIRILIIDEAHQLLSMKNTETNIVVDQLLREARKFNTSVMLISQNNNDVPNSIKTQFQNIIKFREAENEETNDYPDKVCSVSLYDAKCKFIMQVDNVLTYFEKEKNKT